MSFLKDLSAYRFSRYFKLGFLLWDLLLLNGAIILSFLLRYEGLDQLHLKEVRTVSLVSNLVWVFLLLYKDAYRIIRIERIETILIRMIKHMVIHISVIAVFVTVLKYSEISRLRLLYFYLIFFILLFASRVAFMKFLKYIRAVGYNFKNVIVVGANDAGERIVRNRIGGPYNFKKIKAGWLPLHPTVYLRKALVDKYGAYNLDFKIASDTEFLLRYLFKHKINMIYLDEYVVKMRMGGLSTNYKRAFEVLYEDYKIYNYHQLSAVRTVFLKKLKAAVQYIKK